MIHLCVNYFAKCATKWFPNINDIGWSLITTDYHVTRRISCPNMNDIGWSLITTDYHVTRRISCTFCKIVGTKIYLIILYYFFHIYFLQVHSLWVPGSISSLSSSHPYRLCMKMETSQTVKDLILKTQPWGLVLLQGLVVGGETRGSKQQEDLDLQVLRGQGDLNEEISPHFSFIC